MRVRAAVLKSITAFALIFLSPTHKIVVAIAKVKSRLECLLQGRWARKYRTRIGVNQ